MNWKSRFSNLLGLEILHAVGKSGVRYSVCPRKGFSTKTAGFSVNFGGAHGFYTCNGIQNPIPSGAAHYLEHVLFKVGDRNMADDMSARGAECNAETGHFATSYYFNSVNDFSENLDAICTMCFAPGFTKEAVECERGIILAEHFQYLESPHLQAHILLRESLFGKSNSSIDLTGSADDIRGMTHATLMDLHHTFYSPGNVHFVAVGDVNPDEFMIFVEGRAKAGSLIPNLSTSLGISETVETTRKSFKGNVSRPLIEIAWRIDSGFDRICRDFRKFRLALVIACEALFGEISDFYQSCIDSGLADDTLSHSVSLDRATGMYWISTATSRPDDFHAKVEQTLKKAPEILSDSALIIDSIRKRVTGKATFASSSIVATRKLLLKPVVSEFPPPVSDEDILSNLKVEDVVDVISKALLGSKRGSVVCLPRE